MITRTVSLRRLASMLAAALLAITATPAFADPGDLDTSFGTGGVVRTNTTVGDVDNVVDAAYWILLQPDGKIVTVGPTDQKVPVSANPNGRRLCAAVVRYNVDGSLDTTFGSGGIAHVSFTKSGSEVPSDAALQPDGKILVVSHPLGSAPKMLVARLLADGTPDRTFGKGGKVKVKLGKGVKATADSVVVQPDGKIVLFGVATNNKLAVARLNGADGSLDPTFGVGGRSLGVLNRTT